MPLNVENGVLACVVELLDGVATYSEQRDLETKRRRRKARGKKLESRKRVKTARETKSDEDSMTAANTES